MAIRKSFRKNFGKKYNLHFPTNKKLCGDNAGMIGVATYFNIKKGKTVELKNLERSPNLSL